jgi:hypothetical protein
MIPYDPYQIFRSVNQPNNMQSNEAHEKAWCHVSCHEAQSREQEIPFLREIPLWQGTRRLFPLASFVFLVKKEGFPEKKLLER